MPRKVVEDEGIEDEVEQEIVRPKRVLSEAQLANLKKAREAAALKKKELKETKNKAKNKEKLELEVKAMEYDKLLKKKQDLVEPETPTIKPSKPKKVVKQIIREVEESESESEEEVQEVIVKKVKPKQAIKQEHHMTGRVPNQSHTTNYNQMLYQSATHTIQEKLLDERAKSLVQKLMPSY